MKVAAIATVKNESGSIRRLLDSLMSQTRQPDEIIIVDGGSTDDTLEILYEYVKTQAAPLQVLEAPGSNISKGRNVAIEASHSERCINGKQDCLFIINHQDRKARI